MAQDADAEYQQYLKSVSLTFAVDYTAIAMIALPIWEYLITFDREIDVVWRRKPHISAWSILLVSTRICMVLAAILLIVSSMLTNCLATRITSNTSFILNLVGFAQTAVFSAFRVSALHNRNLILFLVVFMLALVPVPVNLFSISHTVYVHDLGACDAVLTLPNHLINSLSIATRVSLIVADVIVLIFTWVKTYDQVLESRYAGVSIPLSVCLSRDGTLYFVCFLALNIGQIVAHTSRQLQPVATIAASLPPILINRFMLNLRQAGGMDYTDSLHASTMSTPRFQFSASALGNMGESLEHGDPRAASEDELSGDQEDNVA